MTTERRLAPLDETAWYYRAYLTWAEALFRYHRMEVAGAPHDGPCLYVALHGAGYFVTDLVLLGYWLGWREHHLRGRPRRPLRIVAAQSRIERWLPGLPTVKDHFGLIDPSEPSCLAALRGGEQLLVTPGGSREAQPSRDFYRLRWEGRYGFVRLALATGLPIVPVAVAGGAEAFPGFRWRKLSFWSPLPLPARLRAAVGQPIPVPLLPDKVRDAATVRPLHELAWRRTQALLDGLRAGDGA